MKKLIAMLLALTMVFSFATVAFAAKTDDDGNFVDEQTITITKWYNNTNAGVSPKETLNFTIKFDGVTDAGVEVDVDKLALPTVDSVTYEEGDAGKVIIENSSVDYKCKRDIVVTLPEYTGVGVYTYTINETAGTMAGVTYYTDDIKLVVTVIQDENGKIRVAAVHTEDKIGTDVKNDTFTNTYDSGKLAVSKTVTGNLGDQDKNFNVKVIFTAPDGLTVGAPITYTEDGESKSIAGGWTESKEVTIDLKHDETVTFENIPYGVTYAVREDDYTADGYDKPIYKYGEDTYAGFDPTNSSSIVIADLDNKVDAAEKTVNITNNKEESVDTGITLDSMPYVLMLVIACAGVVLFVGKKRHED